jgi:DNA-binding PadR family transcriptional regulator
VYVVLTGHRVPRSSYFDISCYSVAVHSTALEWPCFSFRRSGGRMGILAAGVALTMAARGRGRHGAWFGRGGGFGPFFSGPGGFPRGPRARRGDVRTAALLLLAEGPLNGYQIMQEIERRSDGVWRPSPGSVYPALAQLEDEGLVRTEQVGERRTYVLTDAGRAQVDERRDDLGAPWEQMTDSVDDDVGALFREMRRVGMAAGQIGHLGGASQVAQARRVLAEARRALYALLAEDETDE